MPARVPLDVDLEDRLLYGLTPMRLAYAIGALLAGFAIWSTPWGPGAMRAAVASLVIGIGAIISWGRWRGTPADVWIVELVLFAIRTRRVAWTARRPRIPWLKRASSPTSASASGTLTPAA